MKKLLKKLRDYEIQIRKAITSHHHGNFHSIFKGSGLEFDDVRSYQYGDDVRAIDWKVSAKGHGTFVKTYKEEREQSIYFLLDVSASQQIGNPEQQKVDIGKELCGVLTLSAIRQSSQVGIICYSDQPEMYMKSGKGHRHAIFLLKKLFSLQAASQKTDLKKAITYSANFIKRRSVIFIISDFIDQGYQQSLKALMRKHDVILVHLSDRRETQLPDLGIIPLLDKESGQTVWVNTSSKEFKDRLGQAYQHTQAELEELCQKLQANYVAIDTEENYVPKLIKLFRVRNKTKGVSRA
jgi:uncharacterized protein (DUF58 family)